MAIRRILGKNEEILRKKSKSVKIINGRTNLLIDDMLETLADAHGAGLAAPQVGVLRRVVIVDVGEGPIVMINPKLTYTNGEQETVEGCLSVPGEWGITRRPMSIKAEYTDRDGNLMEIEASEMMAKAICHEIDHLDGILFTDKVLRMVKESELVFEDDDEGDGEGGESSEDSGASEGKSSKGASGDESSEAENSEKPFEVGSGEAAEAGNSESSEN
jgi:peptide deformylase